ncbi:MAG: peptidase [Rudaea sp.]|nr:peptidase [Rudaea sp.]
MYRRSLAGLLLIAALAACSQSSPDAAKPTQAEKASPALLPAPPSQPPGSDRDAHGCIPSAGYTWCAATNKCERPWELAKEKAFDNSAEAFDKFSANAAK